MKTINLCTSSLGETLLHKSYGIFQFRRKKRIWGMIQNRKGEIGGGVQETFQENMQMWEKFECFVQIREDGEMLRSRRIRVFISSCG